MPVGFDAQPLPDERGIQALLSLRPWCQCHAYQSFRMNRMNKTVHKKRGMRLSSIP